MNYSGLALAIIWQAAEDYREKKKEGRSTAAEEKFFKSEWCDFLLQNVKITGNDILRRLERE